MDLIQTPILLESLQQVRQTILESNLVSLTQIVSKLSHAQAALLDLTAFVQYQLIEIQTKLHVIMFKLLLGLLVLLFSILCLFEEESELKKKTKPLPTVRTPPKLSEENDIRDEYDFMATRQALPAKLDLARAYIDMGDVIAARATLLEVLVHGDEAQIHEARGLLGTL